MNLSKLSRFDTDGSQPHTLGIMMAGRLVLAPEVSDLLVANAGTTPVI